MLRLRRLAEMFNGQECWFPEATLWELEQVMDLFGHVCVIDRLRPRRYEECISHDNKVYKEDDVFLFEYGPDGTARGKLTTKAAMEADVVGKEIVTYRAAGPDFPYGQSTPEQFYEETEWEGGEKP